MGLERLRARLRQVLKIQFIFFSRRPIDDEKEGKSDEVSGAVVTAEEDGNVGVVMEK